jgi:hypothetical protein
LNFVLVEIPAVQLSLPCEWSSEGAGRSDSQDLVLDVLVNQRFSRWVAPVFPQSVLVPSQQVSEVLVLSQQAWEILVLSQQASEVLVPSQRVWEVLVPVQRVSEVLVPSQRVSAVLVPVQRVSEVLASPSLS